ncbi:MAG: ATP-dependent helicase, partial [candidate division WOR-3 bacterium]
MADNWLKDLNPQQLAAVTHREGPLLIIAGAGTGKTRTLACRVAWLVQQGVRPERLLLLTFTRRAAEEMLRRAEVACGRTVGRVWGGTFHAVAVRLLRMHGRAVGLDPGFTVMDESDSADLLGLIRTRLGYGDREKRFPRKATIRSIYSRVVDSRLRLADVLRREYPWCVPAADGLARIFAEYSRRKQERAVLDFDDLLLFWNELLGRPEAQPLVEDRFDHVLVDEYQDTNVIQAEILQRLRQRNRNLTVVGDDAQSIYSFRAATIRNILEFPQQFPGATVVALEQNYRSVQPILDLGNAIMQEARFRYTKQLYSTRASDQRPVLLTCRDEHEQAGLVCDRILEHREQGIPLREQAVLFRTGYHSDMLEIELTRRDIPFRKYGGLRFLEAAHVKDVMAILRIAENPRDEVSWFRVLEMLSGIGPRTAERFLGELAGREFNLRRIADIEMPAAARNEFDRLCALLGELTRPSAPPLPGQLEL